MHQMLFSLSFFFVTLLLGAALQKPETIVSDSLRKRDDVSSMFANMKACINPELSALLGMYPPSAVTTKQTGKDCTEYGSPLQKSAGLGNWSASFENTVQTACLDQILFYNDGLGSVRAACFYSNPSSTKERPLPLIVYVPASMWGASFTFSMTGLGFMRDIQPLNEEDPSRLGYSYIIPYARNIDHVFPFPDDKGLGWDHWYRNTNRSSPALNPDIAFLDHAIAYAKGHAAVDPRRVFLTGWSNGASMALFYAMNTDAIAAASVYSAPDPYRDSQDPCAQTPYPKFATPIRDIHNNCDVIGICTTGKYFFDDLRARYPHYQNSIVVIDQSTQAILSMDEKAQCLPACQGACVVTSGAFSHARWPLLRNSDTLFDFMLRHPLPISGTWGSLDEEEEEEEEE